MAAARQLLHKSKVEAFKRWLDAQGISHRPGRGDFELLQVLRSDGQWFKLYERLHMPEHVTVQGPLTQLVRRFVNESRRSKAEDFGTCDLTIDNPPGSDVERFVPSSTDTPPWD